MNSDWIRCPEIERVFYELHQIKPEIYVKNPTERNLNRVKIHYQNKEFYLTEKLQDGLTSSVVLEYDNKTEVFKRVYDAERRIKEMVDGNAK